MFEDGAKVGYKRLLLRMRTPPAVDEALECLHQENRRAAAGVEDADVPIVAVPWEHCVEHMVHEVRGCVVGFVLAALLGGEEFLVNAADEFQRDSVE